MAQPGEGSLISPAAEGALAVKETVTDRPEKAAPVAGYTMLVVYVAVCSSLLALHPARDSEFWKHVAAGRELVAHPVFFSETDSESQGSASRRSWLYDVGCYGVELLSGPRGVVVCKALLIVALALVLLFTSRGQGDLWIPTACTIAALLTMSTQLFVRPATVSFLFLGLTLWLLRRGQPTTADTVPFLPPWPLLVLFLIWANIDGWVVLGLVVVALIWLGQLIDESTSSIHLAHAAIRRGVALCILAAICLLNPSHWHVFDIFALMPELGGVFGTGVSASLQLPWSASSPFQSAYLTSFATNPAGLSYFLLLILGVVSFLLSLPRLHWQRLLPWVALALLSGLHVRAIPFFAVLTGPVLAWNFQESLAQRVDPEQQQSLRWRRGGFALRVWATTIGLFLLICIWPGWLQGPPFEPRRAAVETSPSLQAAAATLKNWLGDGKMGPRPRGLYLSQEAANTFPWFCPEERAVFDARLTASFFARSTTQSDRDAQLRELGINHIILHSSDRPKLYLALGWLLLDREHWPLLIQEGDVAVFGWRDPQHAESAQAFRGLELDFNRPAFQPSLVQRAPPKRPDRYSESRHWWEAFWKPLPPPSIDRAEAMLLNVETELMAQFPPLRDLRALRNLTVWETSNSAAMIGAASGWSGPSAILEAYVRAVVLQPQPPAEDLSALPALDRAVIGLQKRFTLSSDDTPPALLYLAIRAGRRAVAANPEDALAYLELAESYRSLLSKTRERAWSARLPKLAELRQAQCVAALNRAVALKPDLASAHQQLGQIYAEINYVDLSLKHRRAAFELIRRKGPVAGVSAEQFRQQENQTEKELNRLAKTVENLENSYVKESVNLSVLDRAMLALSKGLAGRARDMLVESNVAAFGPDGMKTELELLLRTGRALDVLNWTEPEQAGSLGAAPYHWFRAQAFAATGDYALAEEECNLLEPADPAKRIRLKEDIALSVGQIILNEHPGFDTIPGLLQRDFFRSNPSSHIAELMPVLRRNADAMVLRGVLALEEGDTDEADVMFRTALALWKDDTAATSGAGIDFAGRVIAQGYLALLE